MPSFLGAAQIVIDQATRPPGVPGVPRDDGVTHQLVTLRNLDNTNISGTTGGWLWTLAKPRTSTAVLSSPTSPSCTFVPDVDGTYLVTLSVNEKQKPSQIASSAIAVRDIAGFRYPAQGERRENTWVSAYTLAPNETGWWEDIDKILRSGQAAIAGSHITVDPEPGLPNSRQLIAGTGITLNDLGPGNTLEIAASFTAGTERFADLVGQPENIVSTRTVEPGSRSVTAKGQVNLGCESLPGKGTQAGYASITGGLDNLAGGTGAFIGAGELNTCNSIHGAIVSGASNTATGTRACIGAGTNNIASGTDSAVLAGNTNTAMGTQAVVAGGNTNIAGTDGAFVGGGSGNNAAGLNSGIAAGATNSSSGTRAFVGGGNNNTASTQGSGILAGAANTVSAQEAVIGGGSTNAAAGLRSAVGAGHSNTCDGPRGFIGAGSTNTIGIVNDAVVVGGAGNTASNDYAAILGGQDNTASGWWSAVGGGSSNVASGLVSFVGSGDANTASGDYSSIIGGSSNQAQGDYSSVIGGRNSLATQTDSHALGRGAQATFAGSVVLKDGAATTQTASASDELTLRFDGGIRQVTSGAAVTSFLGSSTANYSIRVQGQAVTADGALYSGTLVTIPTDADCTVRGVLKGKEDGSAEARAYVFWATYTNDGGAVSLVTSYHVSDTKNTAGAVAWVAQLGISGTSIEVQFSGLLGTTVRWTWDAECHVGGSP